MLYILSFVFGFIVCLFGLSASINLVTTNTFKLMEKQILLSGLSLVQYKFHALKILEIAYDAAEEKYPSKAEEYKIVVEKVNEKFDGYGEEWIKLLISRLPYKTEYSDWKTALAYAERLLTNRK